MHAINPLIRFAYRLESQQRYQNVKAFFRCLLTDDNARHRQIFDVSMILLVLLSVLFLLYDVKHELNAFALGFEYFAVTVFIIEYLLRLWVHNDCHRMVIDYYEQCELLDRSCRLAPLVKDIALEKWRYMTTPLAVIDLLAIIPSYRPLRFLRILLLFRLFKLFRYSRSVHEFTKVLAEKRFEFFTLAIFISFLVFTSAAAIYFFEGDGQNPKIANFFDAIYWSLVTISTVGYGDITPVSYQGQIITLILIIAGIGVISFSTSIVVAAFSEKLVDLRESRNLSEIHHRHDHTVVCGYGRMGQELAKLMLDDPKKLIIVEYDEQRASLARSDGLLVIQGDATHSGLLEKIGVAERAQRVLALTDDDVSNVYITLTARHLSADIEIIARANQSENRQKMLRAGADQVVQPYDVIGSIAAQYIGQPLAFEALSSILSGSAHIRSEALRVRDGSDLCTRAIGEVDFQSQRLLLLGVIREEGRVDESQSHYALGNRRFYFNPSADFCLQAGDLLVLFGHEFSLYHFIEAQEQRSRRAQA